ncbi:DoxX family protein [Mucilaginibacter myungsuensis]|uniref:DoxX family protein n=1 Tax=Mucilaginibacter myungsuensis TaxID=649104 RepID=A0A929KZS2_9SPHI|nr:DoxX family protein [Mucilaginibacter myungsuensis]MBE9663565.1 DoxX family protein [Mucilaginibacter myungsuensis]MDN3599111.1 hypothetical protein [Mucilaginibacter myungsuensis]
MNTLPNFHKLYLDARRNRWMNYFTVFCRLALAAGFIPPGIVKINHERFTDLHNNQPMGHYLEALYHTGYYHTFIGYLQVTAGLLLLIPRTAIMGALLYFPIILNICILSLSVRFEGSLVTSPLMVIANLYLLVWYYDRLQFVFPFKTEPIPIQKNKPKQLDNKFPIKFFGGAFATVVLVVFTVTHMFEIMPRNTISDCEKQCKDSENPRACQAFCDSIHNSGMPLHKALDQYNEVESKPR